MPPRACLFGPRMGRPAPTRLSEVAVRADVHDCVRTTERHAPPSQARARHLHAITQENPSDCPPRSTPHAHRSRIGLPAPSSAHSPRSPAGASSNPPSCRRGDTLGASGRTDPETHRCGDASLCRCRTPRRGWSSAQRLPRVRPPARRAVSKMSAPDFHSISFVGKDQRLDPRRRPTSAEDGGVEQTSTVPAGVTSQARCTPAPAGTFHPHPSRGSDDR